jgi:hypothetical protein
MKRLRSPEATCFLAFFTLRGLFILSMPLAGLTGFGDLPHFYHLSRLGMPFISFWSEFPPVFPFLSRLLYHLARGQEHVYDYLLVFLLTAVQSGSLVLFMRVGQKISGERLAAWRLQSYFLLSLALNYGWWYFDPLAVFWMLLGLLWTLEGKDSLAGAAIGMGILTKLFPGLVLVVAWLARPKRQALQIALFALILVALVYGGLFLVSPKMTVASLVSQMGKGSWETVWALIDGNFNTGNFGGLEQRFDPSAAGQLMGNASVFPPWLTLIFFGMLGAWLFYRARPTGRVGQVAFLGISWSVFLLWSPGWSPQWVLYLLPLILLVLPQGEALLVSLTLVLVNLLEWPVLLSRGFFTGLWLTIPLRTLLLLVLGYAFWKVVRRFPVSTREEVWKTGEFP